MKLDELIQRMEERAPLRFAEAWDNVGLLLEPLRPRRLRRVMLTIDLSEAAAEEAVTEKAEAVISYHPILFNGVKRLRAAVPEERTVMKLIRAGIAVYSPHTALDCAPGGTNDWLAGGCGEGTVSVLAPDERDPAFGPGRLLRLGRAVRLNTLIRRLKQALEISQVRVARAAGAAPACRTIALCAGAGASVLGTTAADVFLTGEMRHHDVLAAQQRGTHVILCEHTHTERGYLQVLRRELEAECPPVRFFCSAQDRDPLTAC